MITITTAQREHLLHGGTVGVRVRVSPVTGDPFNITGVNIVDRSMTVDSKCTPGNDLVIGYAEAAELLFSLVLDDAYSAVAWEGARLTVYLNIAGSEVQVGIYTVDEPTRWRGTIAQIRALDNMARFNREFEPSQITGTTTATILSQICTRVNVTYVNENVANITVDRAALEGLTYTQIVGYIAGLSGCNALCDEQGRLVFKLPTATGLEYPARIVTHEEYADAPVTVTGVQFVQDARTEYTESGSVEIPAVNVLVGMDEYVLDVSDNVLIAGLTESQIEARLQAIYSVWNTVSYYPARSLTVTGLPHLQPMDTVKFGDRLTLVTGHNYAVNSTSVIKSAGEPETVKGYATGYEFTAEQRQIIAGIAARRAGYVEQVVTDAYEAAALALHEEIVNALGFWQTEIENPDGSKTVYTHDKPTLAESMYIEYKPGAGQFAWTTTGWNGGSPTWQYGITRDGNMILQALSVHKLTADMILLQGTTTTAQEAFDAAVTVFRDIPQPPYKQGDLWHMPELTVDYWYNSGLTVDQVMALGFTVDERMGGNSYVCINGRASGSFNRADWELTGTTDKTSANLSERITTNETQITNMGMTVSEVTEVVDGHGTSLGTAHSKISNLEAAQLTMIDQINAVGDVFTDIPQPPYKVGDVWHMPELTVDYWYNSGLTVDQIIALGFTVKDRMGGNSYVCVNGRASGSFKRSDWMATGTTDTASVIHESAYGAIEARLTQKIDGVETAVTEVRAGYVRIAQIDGTLGETIIDGDVINTGSVTGNKIKAGEITGNHLAVDSITANKIKAGEIITEKLAIGAVNEDRLANNAVSEDKIKANAVTADKIKALAISSTHLAANSVIAGKIATNAVTATTIAAGAVTAGKIAANSITATELSTIAGFTFSDSTMSSGSGTSRVYISGNPSFSSYAIIIGGDSASTAPFRVSRAGALVASNATITGTVTSANFTSSFGQIGPLKISSQGLTYTSSGRFQINASGYLVASGVELSGKLSGCYKTGSGGIWIDQKNHLTRIKDNSGNWRVFGLQTFWAASDSGGGTTYPVTALAIVSGSPGGEPPDPGNPGGPGTSVYPL